MIWNVREDRLLVISDIHLGNLFFNTSGLLFRFLEYAARENYNLCINGDGLDIVQTSLIKMTKELSAAFDYLGRLVRGEARIYYVIGNHDIILEHFIEDFQHIHLAPFLNVTSGDKRIRVEHGHLYDPFFARHPDLYFAVTRLAGLALRIHPSLYHVHTFNRRVRATVNRAFRRGDGGGQNSSNEPRCFRQAARELSRRGFDAVVLGHTHLHGMEELEGGGTYYNTGSWFKQPHYVKIEQGDIELLPWKG